MSSLQVLQSLASIDPIQLCSEARGSADGAGLYARCVAAGLVTRDDAAVGRGYGAEEAARLHALFDVALENGLAALVSHCILRQDVMNLKSATKNEERNG